MSNEKLVEHPLSRQSELISRLKKLNIEATNASKLVDRWRYIDFINPQLNTPCLALEWLFGARGLLAGRILQLRAKYSRGKSSFMYLLYASAQKNSNAFCVHIETEGAASPPDYIASFGCDPDNLLMREEQSLDSCFAFMDTLICEIRGGFGGGINEATGRKTKSQFTDPIDPENKYPIVIGIDSLSSLGIEENVKTDVVDGSTSAISYHTRKLRQYFRDRVGRFRDTQTLLILTSHETAKIETNKRAFGGGGSQDKSSLAQEAIGIHATYGVDLSTSTYLDPDTHEIIGDIITLNTFKNKLSPRYREIRLYLVTNKGFDLIKTDLEFLLKHPASPFAVRDGQEKILYQHAHGITCKLLKDKPFKSAEEFLSALYSNQDLLMTLREKLRIRGFGFQFENQYFEHDDNQSNSEQSTTSPETKVIESSDSE